MSDSSPEAKLTCTSSGNITLPLFPHTPLHTKVSVLIQSPTKVLVALAIMQFIVMIWTKWIYKQVQDNEVIHSVVLPTSTVLRYEAKQRKKIACIMSCTVTSWCGRKCKYAFCTHQGIPKVIHNVLKVKIFIHFTLERTKEKHTYFQGEYDYCICCCCFENFIV